MMLHVFSKSTQAGSDMPLVIINPASIHDAITDRKRKWILCPYLVAIRRYCIIVVVENDSLGIWT